MRLRFKRVCGAVLLGSAGGLALVACDRTDREPAVVAKTQAAPPEHEAPAPDRVPASAASQSPPAVKLAAFQSELLDLAFKTASAMPLDPHIKSRSRAQESVVNACLELGDGPRAIEYAEKIANWRRGLALSAYALFSAKRGDVAEVERCLALAQKIVERPQDPDYPEQEWRLDRMIAGIARARAALAQLKEGRPASVGPDGLPRSVQQFDELVATSETMVTAGGFDQLRDTMDSCAGEFDASYADASRRAQLEDLVVRLGKKMPAPICIEIWMTMAKAALVHGDHAKAMTLTDLAQGRLDGGSWSAEDKIPIMARLAELRHRLGETARARRELDAAVTFFQSQRENIADLRRADALRPLAEAYQGIADPGAALEIYRRAVDEGAANVNARPRADDLTATCLSMALHSVNPDAVLWSRLFEIHYALGHPW